MKSSLSLSPQRNSVDRSRSRSRSKNLERWFKETYSPTYLHNKFATSLESSSLRFSSPSQQIQLCHNTSEDSARRYFKKLAVSGSPRYMSPTYNTLKPDSPGDYAVGCSICGCHAIKDVCFTHNDSPLKIRPSHRPNFANLRDPDCGAYACIYKKESKPYDGEETEQIQVMSSKVIEDYSPEMYSTSHIEVIKADPDYEGPEVSKVYYREVIPPVKSALTRMNWEDRKMVSETLYHNAIASEYVREEERLRVAVRRSEYSNRFKGVARDMVVTSITGKEDSQDILKQLAMDLTNENREDYLNSLLTPQRELSVKNSTDRGFTPLKVDQPKELSLLIQEKKMENTQLGYRKLTKGGEKILPNRRNRFSREENTEELKVPHLRKSPLTQKLRSQDESSSINTDEIVKPQEEKRISDGGSDNSLEIQLGRKPNKTSQNGKVERVRIRRDSELNLVTTEEQNQFPLLNVSRDEPEPVDNLLNQFSIEVIDFDNTRRMAANHVEIETLPYFYKTAANGSKKGLILKAMKERNGTSEFVSSIKTEMNHTLTIQKDKDDSQKKPLSINLLEESKKSQFKGKVSAKKTERTLKHRSNSPHKSPGDKKGTKTTARTPVADCILRRNLKRKLDQHSSAKLVSKTKQNPLRAELNNKLSQGIPDIDPTLPIDLTIQSKSSSNQEDLLSDSLVAPNLTSSLADLSRDDIRPDLHLSSIPEHSHNQVKVIQDVSESELSLDGHITARFEESIDCLSPGKKSYSEKLSVEDSDMEHDSIRIKKLDEAECTESIKGDEKETMFEISLRANNSKDTQDKIKSGVRKPVSQYFKDIKDTKQDSQNRLKVDNAEIEPEASPNRVDTTEDVRRILGSPNGICSEQEVELEASPSKGSDKTPSSSESTHKQSIPGSTNHNREKDYGLDFEMESPRNPVYQPNCTLAASNIELLRMSSEPIPNTILASDINLTKSNSKPEYINAKVSYPTLQVDKKGLPKDSYFSQKYDKLMQEINSISVSDLPVQDLYSQSRSPRSDDAQSNPSIQTQIRVLNASSDKADLFTGSSLSSVRGRTEEEEKYLHPSQETKIFIGTLEESPRLYESDTLRSIVSDSQTEIIYEENESNAFNHAVTDQEIEIYPVHIEREYEDRGMFELFHHTPAYSEEIELKFSSKFPTKAFPASLDVHDGGQYDITYKLPGSTTAGKNCRTGSDGYLQLKLNESPKVEKSKRSKFNSEPITVRFDDDDVKFKYPDPQIVKAVSITDIEIIDLKSFSESESNKCQTPREESDIKDAFSQLGSFRYSQASKSKAFRFNESESDSDLRGKDGLSEKDFEMRGTQGIDNGSQNSSKHDLPRSYISSPKFSTHDQETLLKEPELPSRIHQTPEKPFQNKEYQSIRGLTSAKTNPIPSLRRNPKPSVNSVTETIQTLDSKLEPISKDFSTRLKIRDSASTNELPKHYGISSSSHITSDLADSIRVQDDQISESKLSKDHEIEKVTEIRTEITKKLIDKRTGEELKKTTKTVEKKIIRSQKYSEMISKHSRGRRTISHDFSFQSLNSSKQEDNKHSLRTERHEHKSIEPQDLSSRMDRLLEHFQHEKVLKGLKFLGGFVDYLERDGHLLEISRE